MQATMVGFDADASRRLSHRRFVLGLWLAATAIYLNAERCARFHCRMVARFPALTLLSSSELHLRRRFRLRDDLP